jgi:hypothetical protein
MSYPSQHDLLHPLAGDVDALTMLLTQSRGDAYTTEEVGAMAHQAGFRGVTTTPLSPSLPTLLELLC